MPNLRPGYFAPLLALIACTYLAGQATAPAVPQAGPIDENSYVQVTSVTVEPATIHKLDNLSAATVVVQVLVHGKLPPHSTATVELATYSTDPPGIKVYFPKGTQTVALDKDLIVVTFTAEARPDTAEGKVIMAASVPSATGVREIKEPWADKDWRAELVTAVP
jgi:hypothetical protein